MGSTNRARSLQPPVPECIHVSKQPAHLGQRRWYQCKNGFGSTMPDERAGHVCRCNLITDQRLWRIGDQCGPSCSGYTLDAPPEPPLQQLEFKPRKNLGVIRWACALTTVPSRRNTTLPLTLRSLGAAGFPAPRLFVDGDADGERWAAETGLEVTARGGEPVRTFGNWVLAAAELYIRNPLADRFAIFQDDFVTYRNLRGYLEKCTYPSVGYWNLYTFPMNAKAAKGQKGWYESNQAGLGAVALVFDRVNLLRVITHEHMAGRPMDPVRGHRAVDGGIVTAMRKVGGFEYVHSPSLVQHIGHTSTMGSKRHPKAPDFYGEDFDAMELVERLASVTT